MNLQMAEGVLRSVATELFGERDFRCSLTEVDGPQGKEIRAFVHDKKTSRAIERSWKPAFFASVVDENLFRHECRMMIDQLIGVVSHD